ncbi:MAG TPA: hypothetical protein VMO47_01315 [Rhodothermales bacterium]|nr:hypothetical protein [Rhodothermales bacterium]
MTQRRQFRRILYVVAAVFAAIVLVDALDLFSNKNWSEIPHGNHSHYSPHNRDENVSVSDCPQRPPGENEMLSSQCQLIQLVKVDGTTHYAPVDRNQNVPIARFPTRPPGPGVIITATGELAAAGDR